MELRHLQSFAEAAERGSFTRAAESLRVTQAAVSQHIAALETELNVRLFDRRGRGVHLTEPGQQMYQYARRILELVSEATRTLGASAQHIAGAIAIATSSVPAEWLVPELLVEFREQYPGIRESLTVSDSSVATSAVEHGDADVGFVGEVPQSSKLNSTAVAQDELVLVSSADHPWTATGTATLKQLSQQPLIVREPESGSRRCVEKTLRQHGISPADLQIAMEVNNNDAIRAAVERGVGVAFLSQRDKRHKFGLTQIALRGFHARRQLHLVYNAQRPLTHPARLFVDFVKQWSRDKPT
ncbi:MAG: selenium metabolism-associated LysR family transcriptional regulator [Planctomycetaceae bacterium]